MTLSVPHIPPTHRQQGALHPPQLCTECQIRTIVPYCLMATSTHPFMHKYLRPPFQPWLRYCATSNTNRVALLVQTTFNLLQRRNVGAFTVSQQHMLRLHQSQIATGVLNVDHEEKQAWDQSHKLDLI